MISVNIGHIRNNPAKRDAYLISDHHMPSIHVFWRGKGKGRGVSALLTSGCMTGHCAKYDYDDYANYFV